MNRTRITIYALLLAFAAPLLPLGDTPSSRCDRSVGERFFYDGNGRWLRVRAGEPSVGIYWKEERT